MLDCLQYAKSAWDLLTQTTIRNCWRHADLQAVEGPELAEPQHVFPELDNDVAQLNELDDNLPVACPPSDDTATIVQMLNNNNSYSSHVTHGRIHGLNASVNEIQAEEPKKGISLLLERIAVRTTTQAQHIFPQASAILSCLEPDACRRRNSRRNSRRG